MAMDEDDLKYIGSIFDTLAETFEREARISEQMVTLSEDRRNGQAEAYRACAEACIKAGTRRMYLFPEPWIGFQPPVEAR